MPSFSVLSGLPVASPMATPRASAVGLPVVEQSSPQEIRHDSRKRAREERHLQYLEEERLEDELAIATITTQFLTLRMPFVTVKTEFDDLDGLRHTAPLRPSRPTLPSTNTFTPVSPSAPDETTEYYYSGAASPALHSVPPLTSDATIRAAVSANRRAHLPSSFKAPGSPQLDATRKTRRRWRATSERTRRPGSTT